MRRRRGGEGEENRGREKRKESGYELLFLLQMLHESVYDKVLENLKLAYSKVPIGDPLEGKSFSEGRSG